jgi:hypothetical protein
MLMFRVILLDVMKSSCYPDYYSRNHFLKSSLKVYSMGSMLHEMFFRYGHITMATVFTLNWLA